MIRALIFDFDGLILETEEPTFLSWVEVYQSFGFPLPFSTWSAVIGTTHGDFDPQLELEKLLDHRWIGRRLSQNARQASMH
jgi:beta-phosphoglucomutase-like phosphatase (HAD superfamily)